MEGPLPRQSKGARLWLRTSGQEPVWVIKDGDVRVSTGCGEGDRAGAEKALAAFLAAKHNPNVDTPGKGLDEIPVADVLNLYARDVTVARPDELGARLERLLDWWGTKTLADVKKASCLAYAATRPPVAGRRELEDLRAAIGHYMAEGKLRFEVVVTLPDKPASRKRWLTRDEVAQLVAHCWRHRETQRGLASRRYTRRHLARFILVAVYTGTRSGAVCSASFEQEEGRGWVDLATGVFHRRAEGEVETRKRKPAVRLPEHLLGHMRRWRLNGQRYVIEHHGRPVETIKRAFRAAVRDLGWDDVTPHSLRHTTITWAMKSGEVTAAEVGAFAGMTERMVDEVYGHHHPDFQAKVAAVVSRRGRRLVPARTETGPKIPEVVE